MAEEHPTIQNFASGELSPLTRGRFELPIYQNGSERQVNFISEVEGPARFRSGSVFVNHTRRNRFGILIPFQYNDQQAYGIEITPRTVDHVTKGYMRFFRNEVPVLEDGVTISGATQANPVVVTTSGAHGYSTGDEVFIDDVAGMTELNGKYYIITVASATTFELQDQDEVDVDGTGFTAYSSGGNSSKIVEIESPYQEAHLRSLKITQNADTAYLVSRYYEPRKLTRTSLTAFSLALFTRTNDPFLDKKTISGITAANPAVVTTSGAHGYSTGDEVIIEGVAGMTEINGGVFSITVLTSTTFSLQTLAGSNFDSSGFTAYSSGGYASDRTLLSGAVGFYESRLFYGGYDANPEGLDGSRAPDTSTGVARYDDFTTGSNPDDAVTFTITPQNKEVDQIRWILGLEAAMALGTFAGVQKGTGSPSDEAIAPDSISVRPMVAEGSADISAVSLGSISVYLERNGLTVRSLEKDALYDSYQSVDRNLTARHIPGPGIVQMAFQKGRPDLLWAVRSDGLGIALTFKAKEDVSGWHRHPTRSGDTVISFLSMPRPSSFDQLWQIVKRNVNGTDRYYVEYFKDDPDIPEFVDYFSGEANKAADEARFLRAMFEAQKQYIHVDSSLSYDGSARGSDAGAGVTPAATSGTSVTFTASASVFESTDVGREIWKKAINGDGYGRAVITGYTSATVVTCNITSEFDSTDQMAAGNWYLTTDSVSGLGHLESEEVRVITDGGVHPDRTVSSETISLAYQSSVVHVGVGYTGFIKSTNLEAGGTYGPSQTKHKTLKRVGIKFLNSLGAQFGTSLYNLQRVTFRSSGHSTGRPPPLFSGVEVQKYSDSSSKDKHVYIRQDQPLPCIVQLIQLYMDSAS